jgi:hypothetical protein
MEQSSATLVSEARWRILPLFTTGRLMHFTETQILPSRAEHQAQRRPKFTGVNGSKVSDSSGGGGITWVCIKAKPGIWQPSHAYPLWSSNSWLVS